ncbi:polysaccharide depolymerase [Klebsiella phage KPPK108.1]|uniref:Polysaccharide depolymerase n=1 Tax=Klebsiella phage KPPK108.1 TaxID=2894584 RepID=A0AAE8YKD0_9CAUD|nr:polysaccharide depolymerase [Klebsiella phage KPPK108.1]
MALTKIIAPTASVAGHINLEAYTGTGTTDKASAIAAAVADSKATGYPIVGYGTYHYGSALDLSGVKLVGATLIATGANNAARAVKVVDTVLESVTVVGGFCDHNGGYLDTRKLTIKNNQNSTAAVWSRNRTSTGFVRMVDTTYDTVNYGLLVQGDSGSAITNIRVDGVVANNLRGDAVELNLVHQVTDGIYVGNVDLNNVVGTGTANDFWGIGVGIAGATGYEPGAADTLYARNITVENIHSRNCRQPVHLEKAKNFVVRNCELYPTNSINTASGLLPVGISLAGCTDFTVEGITGEPNNVSTTPMLTTSWGVVAGAYKGPCRNFALRNIKTTGQLRVYTGASDTYTSEVAIENVISGLGSFYKGYASRLDIRGWKSSGLVLQMRHTTGEGVGIMTRNSGIQACIVDVNSTDAYGYPDGSASGMFVDDLYTSGCNFTVEKQTVATAGRGALLKNVPGVYVAPNTYFPAGQYFPKNSIIYKSDLSGMFVVTTGGVFFNATDTIRAAAVGQTYIEANTGVDWAAANPKSGGIKIVIPYAGAGGTDLVTYIVRGAFVSGGVYRVTLADAIANAVPAGTAIRAADPLTYTEVTF